MCGDEILELEPVQSDGMNLCRCHLRVFLPAYLTGRLEPSIYRRSFGFQLNLETERPFPHLHREFTHPFLLFLPLYAKIRLAKR